MTEALNMVGLAVGAFSSLFQWYCGFVLAVMD